MPGSADTSGQMPQPEAQRAGVSVQSAGSEGPLGHQARHTPFHTAAATLRPGVARQRKVLARNSSGHDPDPRDGLLGGRHRATRSQPCREHPTGLHTQPKQRKNIQGENKKIGRCGLIYKAYVLRCATAEQPGRASRRWCPRGAAVPLGLAGADPPGSHSGGSTERACRVPGNSAAASHCGHKAELSPPLRG